MFHLNRLSQKDNPLRCFARMVEIVKTPRTIIYCQVVFIERFYSGEKASFVLISMESLDYIFMV